MSASQKLMAAVVGLVVFCGMVMAISLTDSGELRQLVSKPATVKWYDVGMNMHYMPAYQIDEASAATTYIRLSASVTNEYVKRISVAGTVTTIEFSYCNWTNRASAVYQPINGI